jgi:glycosyltransferase involved in cell wall biosynthesis
METKLLIVQRFYYNFREGFFDYLCDINYKFKLINSTTSKGKVKVHDEAKQKSFIIKTFYFFWGEKYVIFPFLFIKLIRLNPSVIVTEGGANTVNNIPIFLYCKLFGRKYIIWDVGKGYADFGNSPFRKLYMKLYVSLLIYSDHIYGYNTHSKEYFKSLGIEESKVVVLNNTIDTRKIKKTKSDYVPQIPKELLEQASKGYRFLIFVGALVKSKNIENLAELMKMLSDEYYLIIVGEGTPEYKSELMKSFEGTNHVFVGYKRIENLLPYYTLASFSVLPGLGGLSINQSMAFGVPVICKSADGAEKDLIVSGKTGYIYENLKDAHDFIMSKSSDDWKRMGKDAEIFLNSYHSVESMMEKFILYL